MSHILHGPGVEQLQALGVSLQQRSAQWEDYVEALQRFVGREGHTDVQKKKKKGAGGGINDLRIYGYLKFVYNSNNYGL